MSREGELGRRGVGVGGHGQVGGGGGGGDGGPVAGRADAAGGEGLQGGGGGREGWVTGEKIWGQQTVTSRPSLPRPETESEAER